MVQQSKQITMQQRPEEVIKRIEKDAESEMIYEPKYGVVIQMENKTTITQ